VGLAEQSKSLASISTRKIKVTLWRIATIVIRILFLEEWYHAKNKNFISLFDLNSLILNILCTG
ncbi:MAG TPA: hypothetical protein VFC36_07790, partial [Paludibacter sp.]|nr:hypothetical protein [Paludibacter sp.]